jgi:hypothetical protein
MIDTLPRCPTKQEEIDHFCSFVAALPRASYLADILANLPEQVEHEIRCDTGLPLSVSAAMEARRHEEELLAADLQKAKQLRAELAVLERKIGMARDDIGDLRRAALSIARDCELGPRKAGGR